MRHANGMDISNEHRARAIKEETIQVNIRPKPCDYESTHWNITSNQIYLADKENGAPSTTAGFTFDKIYSTIDDNEHIFNDVEPLVESALNGFNTAICAYGHSGSGKTHTLFGTSGGDDNGMVQMTLQKMLDDIPKMKNKTFMIRLSILEIYNETLRDLTVDGASNLKIQVKNDIPVVSALKEHKISKLSDVEAILNGAYARRQMGETKLNSRSSRAHTIVMIHIESTNDNGNTVRQSVMNIVDLAGSENSALAGTSGLALKEGNLINQSLLALKKVITILSDSSCRDVPPFRDSKLTRILKPCLGGNSRTLVFCCISQDAKSETHSTLKFAQQLKNVRSRPTANLESKTKDGVLAKYLTEISLLREQVDLLERQKAMSGAEEERKKMRMLMEQLISGDSIANSSSSVQSQRVRRQTWCPGNGKSLFARSFSPVAKKGRFPEPTLKEDEEESVNRFSLGDERFDALRPLSALQGRISDTSEDVAMVDETSLEKLEESTGKDDKEKFAEQLSLVKTLRQDVVMLKEETSDAFEKTRQETVDDLGKLQRAVSIASALLQTMSSEKLSNALSEIERLNKLNEEYKSELSVGQMSVNERKRLVDTLAESRSVAADMHRKVMQLESEKTDLEESKELVSSTLKARESALTALGADMKAMEEQYETEKSLRLRENVEHATHVKNLMQTHDEEKSKLLMSIDELKKELALDSDVKMTMKNDEISVLTNELMLQQGKYKQLETDMSAAHSKTMEEMRNSLQNQIATGEERIVELQFKIETLEKLNNALTEESQLSMADAAPSASSTAELTAAIERADQLQGQLAILQNKYDDAENNIGELQKQLAVLNKSKAALAKSLSDKESVIAMRTRQCQDKMREVSDNLEALKSLNSDILEKEATIRQLKTELAEAKEAHHSEQNAISKKLADETARVESLNAKVRQLNSENIDILVYKKDLKQTQHEVATITERLTKAKEEEVSVLRAQIADLETRLAEIITVKDAEAKSARDYKMKFDKVMEKMRQKTSSSSETLDNTEKLEAMEKQISDLITQKKELDDKIADYRKQKKKGLAYVDALKEKLAKAESGKSDK